MNYYSYKNLIKKPTRTTETTNTLLDLILVSDSSKVRDADVLDFAIADHKFIYAVYNLTPKKQKPLLVKSQLQKYKLGSNLKRYRRLSLVELLYFWRYKWHNLGLGPFI